jgi:nucleotide-binding universal stress UspA family protein
MIENGFSVLGLLSGGSEDTATIAATAWAARGGAQAAMVLGAPDPAVAFAWSVDGTMGLAPLALETAARATADWTRTAREVAMRRMAEAGLVAELDTVVGAPEYTIPPRLPLVDAVVLDAVSARGGAGLSNAFETILMRGRTPVLLAGGRIPAAGGRAAIAWDGGPEAGRAVRAARPLLALFAGIDIVHAPGSGDRAGAVSPEALAGWLEARGHQTRVLTLTRECGPAQIVEAVRGTDASLLVSGAYGHARAAQWIFGGATRTFLGASDAFCLFMAH